ncbi:Pycsar system effector family protein [Sphingobacterium sp. LRF_L2]|uniref:Pycsar system effector family protein n=1 Tax=Sphingobacterium sp. LRF_L2 TaxID=3369421 RepID=UPI003F60E6EC
MKYEEILQDIEPFLFRRVKELGTYSTFCFHDRGHTEAVVEAVEEMSVYYKLSSQDRFIVVCAAYFHDIGYLSGGPVGHEQRSADIAVEFLQKHQVPKQVSDQVVACILATKMPQMPTNLLEQIICDADLYHLGGVDFEERNKLMRREAIELLGKSIDKELWRASTIKLLSNHHYHTDYAKERRDQGKAHNLKELMDKEIKASLKQESKKKNEQKNNKPERGIETMFRITSANNQRLSDMADNKANILLTVNSIILSVVVAGLFRKLDSNAHLIIPTFILIIAVVLTIVLAILSTIPKVPGGTFKPEQIENKSANLLFFGNFYRMPFDRYMDGMVKVMEDREFLYGMMTRDVYSQGVVLGRKYRLLRYAYGTFMFGLVLAICAFFISILTY